MHPSEHSLQVYEELADRFDQQQNHTLRDQFLLLAADAALSAGREDEAERVRQRLLWLNPHHSVRAYSSFAEAAMAPGIHEYLDRLRQKYPPDHAEDMLESALGHSAPPASDVPATLPPTPRSKLMPPSPIPPLPGEDMSVYGVHPDESPPAEDDPHPLKVFRGTTDISETMPPRSARPGERPGTRPGLRPPVGPPPRRPDEPPPIAETMPPSRAGAPSRRPPVPPEPPPISETLPPQRRVEPPPPEVAQTVPPRRTAIPPVDLPPPARPSQLGGAGPPAPPARAVPVPRQPPAPPAAPPPPPRQPAVRRTAIPPPQPVPSSPHGASALAGSEPDTDRLAGGAWVGPVLFVLVLVGGLALAIASLLP